MDESSLEARLARMEDLEAIKQLKARYCEICDDDHNPDRIVTLFTKDGIWEGEGIGKAEGHAAIRDLFTGFQKAMSFTMHMVMNPIIEIDGDRATGSWYIILPSTFRKGNQARWQAGRYEEDYVKVDGAWKIKHLRVVEPTMSAKYETGWAAK